MEKKISVISKSKVVNNNIEISTEFYRNEGTDNNEITPLNNFSTDEVEMLEEKKTKNGISGLECELLINQNTESIFLVDIDGTISVSDKNVESKYELNDMGELIFKF